MNEALELFAVFFLGIVSIAISLYLAKRVGAMSAGTPKMQAISAATREGAMAYLKRQYQVITVFALAIAVVLGFAIGWNTAAAYIVGALCSAVAGFIGMNNATKANVRTAAAATRSLRDGLKVAFSSGLATSLSVVGIGVAGVTAVYYYLTSFSGASLVDATNVLFGFSMGASSVALFMRVGGGIFTKAADVGADLVGKIEKGIPEDDPRNAAVIADNVGDNVGDVAGVGADLFESYVGAIIAAMSLGALAFGLKGVLLPLLIAAAGIIASLFGALFLRGKGRVENALRNTSIAAAVISTVFSLALVYFLFDGALGAFYAVLSGIIVGVTIGFISEYYTSTKFKPTRHVAQSSTTGAATTILNGFAVGLQSTVPTIVLVCVSTWVAFVSAGIYGIGLAAVGMLSTLGVTLAADAYGPVADNAGGIVEMSGLPHSVRKRTDELDAAGNTSKAICKGFAVGSAALTALAFFAAYTQVSKLAAIDLMNANVVIGVLLGGTITFLFASLTIQAVGNTAFKLVGEVRRQFKSMPGIMKGTQKPDYARCVDIATVGAIREMILPAILAIVCPVLVGLLLGKEALGGLLAGALVTGVLLGVLMANAGASWDNAKKFIEQGNYGGKGSDAHKASIVGDTVGDPFKDTTGPSMNILIKLMSIVALVSVAALAA
ncbi:MAG: sodium-translocating pyrophosphatase [Candidatus Norongarragalinales archaeon]